MAPKARPLPDLEKSTFNLMKIHQSLFGTQTLSNPLNFMKAGRNMRMKMIMIMLSKFNGMNFFPMLPRTLHGNTL